MAKKNENNYREVDNLPDSALSVAEYAQKMGITTASVYMRKKVMTYEIVKFKTYNFVIPLPPAKKKSK